MRWAAFLTVLCLALVAATSAHAADRVLSGRVVDAAGNGVGDVEVATAWTISGGEIRSLKGVRTDEQGRFVLTRDYVGLPITLMAFDAPRERGTVLTVLPDAVDAEQILPLTALGALSFTVRVAEGDSYPSSTMAWLSVAGDATPVLRVEQDRGQISARLPAATYDLTVQAARRESHRQRITVEADVAPLELGSVKLASIEGRIPTGGLTPALIYTEASPELVGALSDRHVPARWTLCYFWAHH